MKHKNIVVIAGSHAQFLFWCKETDTNPREVVYAESVHHLMGMRDVEIVRVGTWMDNPVAFDPYIQIIEKRSDAPNIVEGSK